MIYFRKLNNILFTYSDLKQLEEDTGIKGYDLALTDEEWNKAKQIAIIDHETGKIIIGPSLNEIKIEKIKELKQERDKKEQEDINYNDKIVVYDSLGRERLSTATKALELSDPSRKITWTLADNTNADFGIQDFNEILLLGAIRSNALHMKYRELRDLVNNATTKEEVEKINWDIIN